MIGDAHADLRAILGKITEAKGLYTLYVGGPLHAAAEVLARFAQESARPELLTAAQCVLAARDQMITAETALAMATEHIEYYIATS